MTGYQVQKSDPDFDKKIAELKRGPSGVERFDGFLTELGIDPRSVRFSLPRAQLHMETVLDTVNADRADVTGNSLGLTSVIFSKSDHEVLCVTQTDPGDVDWHDLTRVFEAFQDHVRSEDAPNVRADHFRVVRGSGGVVVTAAAPVDVNPDVMSYPPGSVLRLQHRDGTSVYARVGGFNDDTEVIVLETLQPIRPLDRWTVVEVLDTHSG